MIPLLLWLWLPAVVQGNSLPGPRDCEVLRMKCAFRSNCAKSLHSYMLDCADVLSGRTARCPWACKRALISLTSHEIGYALANCDCGDNAFCRESKERAEVCRPEVSHATADDTVVSCSVAEWICAADPLCSTALEYYHRLCRSMFHGRKCTPRCNNSLHILGRQEKASKLMNCFCDGSEDYPCTSVQQNTARLCYGSEDWRGPSDHSTTTPRTESGAAASAPPWGLASLATCILVLWTFRTCVADPLARPHAASKKASGGLGPSSRSTELWPWWWTSESAPR